MEMAELGATPKGGVNRPALTPTDIEVHVRLAEWARAREFAVEIDAYGTVSYTHLTLPPPPYV